MISMFHRYLRMVEEDQLAGKGNWSLDYWIDLDLDRGIGKGTMSRACRLAGASEGLAADSLLAPWH